MSNKFRRERKDKYAAVEMISASLEQDNLHLVARFSGISRIYLITEILDIPDFQAYFICHCIDGRSCNDQATVKARSTTRTWCSQSSSRPNTGAMVSIGRFLRSRRSCSGQIRDVASCSGRWRFQGRGGRPVRNVQADLLSSGERLCERGAARVASETAWAQRRAQTQLGGHGVHRGASTAGRQHSRSRACAGDRNLAGAFDPPTQYRTCVSTQKKTVDDSPQFRPPSSALARYEALRADLLGTGPNSEGHAAIRFHGLLHGLAIQRPDASRIEAPTPTVPASNSVRDNGALVRVLANLVLRTHEELAHVY
ncbi:hypothetical protein SAMN05192548_103657 [Paraburkholderia terricola]|uniref:Uncharacterized protein n=1 Tax=Paraburkholderia terricola TaxID=169427 RepID=A0A1M6V2L0_9BURK|nr:hypothetical protein SAMN05192547_103361 [Paraburkholderia sediminicola]SHK75526.1 hypothetical protein SAMN05192548_103657 [Paraburkholderia terricola]